MITKAILRIVKTVKYDYASNAIEISNNPQQYHKHSKISMSTHTWVYYNFQFNFYVVI